MPDLLLHAPEQAALTALAASEPVPGVALPDRRVLALVARLVPCDEVAAALCTGGGVVLEAVDLPPGTFGDVRDLRGAVTSTDRSCRISRGQGREGRGRVDSLRLAVPNAPDRVTVLWLARCTRAFRDHDVAMLALVSPVLQRLVRERPVRGVPDCLTAQERRVLMHVAAGRTNDEIARRLSVSTSTVRKHLEHVYRKLAVPNRQAAVAAVQLRDGPDLDLRERLVRAGGGPSR
ncbi:helix-turn-helix transcriptional regulator [Nocardioides abyssi]|uniref:Helix-turn-helix transcriptional regulator n=1 Tax=Nocardioides abyssi TaxID=3058370 RepID=A0ABT8ERR0_9ACTN|nr:helix-turn-helix transcriptional regulator [Nocardioides abyssi]MDN4160837.1 helix-turn-helix transcriptional regulator [Nocardioides abyssi]